MQQKAKPEIADRITEAVNNMTKDDYCSFWASAMLAKTELDVECSMNTFMPVVREKPCQAMELATPTKPELKDPDTTSVAQSSPLVVPKFISDPIQQTMEGSPALYSVKSSFLTRERVLPGGKHLFADFGWKNIDEHSGVLCCDKMSRNLKPTFIGDVSIFPFEGSIRIGDLLGATMFVTSPAKLGSPFFVPAWGVKPKPTKATTKAKAGPTTEVAIDSGDEPQRADASKIK